MKQCCSVATVRFDDESIADFFDEQVDQGLAPERFGRIWVHTHPSSSPLPSVTDEETFARCFGGADWSLMLILACGGRTYARLRFGVGPRVSLILPIAIDFGATGPAMDQVAWEQEYQHNVSADVILTPAKPTPGPTTRLSFDPAEETSAIGSDPWEYLDERYF